MTCAKVLTPYRRPNESVVRDAFADGLARVQGSKTDHDAADELGWSVGTVRNCRNRLNSLSAKLISDAMFHAGERFLAPFLALHGLRAVPLDASCDSDAGTHCRLAKMAVKIAVALEDGRIEPHEARDMLPELDEWQAHMDRIRTLAGAA